MKRMLSMFLVTAAVALGTSAASAHPRGDRIDQREAWQRARIHAGWRQGDLTRCERWRLRHGQERVRRMEWRARRDGRLTARERWRIERMQDRQSRRIRRFRHGREIRSL